MTDKIFTVFVSFHARDWNDAEDYIYSMTAKDWMEHLEEEEE